jgi:hypothetical protein
MFYVFRSDTYGHHHRPMSRAAPPQHTRNNTISTGFHSEQIFSYDLGKINCIKTIR